MYNLRYTQSYIICDTQDVPDISKGALADYKADNEVRVGRLVSLLISLNYFMSD